MIMTELEPQEYMQVLWDRINNGRKEFQEFINYEWNYAVHFSYHKNYDAKTKISNLLIRSYLKELRRVSCQECIKD